MQVFYSMYIPYLLYSWEHVEAGYFAKLPSAKCNVLLRRLRGDATHQLLAVLEANESPYTLGHLTDPIYGEAGGFPEISGDGSRAFLKTSYNQDSWGDEHSLIATIFLLLRKSNCQGELIHLQKKALHCRRRC